MLYAASCTRASSSFPSSLPEKKKGYRGKEPPKHQQKMECNATTGWGGAAPVAHQCGVLLGSSIRVRNIIVATSGLTPRFDMPIASVREDGGAHRPAQTNLNIYSDCALPSLGGLSVPARFFPSSDAPSPLRRFESAALTSPPPSPSEPRGSWAASTAAP